VYEFLKLDTDLLESLDISPEDRHLEQFEPSQTSKGEVVKISQFPESGEILIAHSQVNDNLN